jgi:hypothetical protein
LLHLIKLKEANATLNTQNAECNSEKERLEKERLYNTHSSPNEENEANIKLNVELKDENTKLKDENAKLKSENTRLEIENDKFKTANTKCNFDLTLCENQKKDVVNKCDEVIATNKKNGMAKDILEKENKRLEDTIKSLENVHPPPSSDIGTVTRILKTLDAISEIVVPFVDPYNSNIETDQTVAAGLRKIEEYTDGLHYFFQVYNNDQSTPKDVINGNIVGDIDRRCRIIVNSVSDEIKEESVKNYLAAIDSPGGRIVMSSYIMALLRRLDDGHGMKPTFPTPADKYKDITAGNLNVSNLDHTKPEMIEIQIDKPPSWFSSSTATIAKYVPTLPTGYLKAPEAYSYPVAYFLL